MYSHIYNYYNIQFDEKFGQRLNVSTVVDAILETKLFRQSNPRKFINSDEFPWADLGLFDTYDGNYGGSDNGSQFVTLIAIVCSKRENINQQIYIDAFKQIASKLNWKLYLEEDDDGNENLEL